MLKKLFLMAVLCSGQPFLYAQDTEVHTEGTRLVELYLKGDSTEIIAHWKLEEEENVDLASLLKMQSDLFGETGYLKNYSVENNFFTPKKTISAQLRMDSLFADCPAAELTCSIFKGKKKKDQFQFTRILIWSMEKPDNSFVDSLCSSYLQMLARGEIDSLINDAINYNEIMSGIEELEKDKENSTDLTNRGLELMRNFLIPGLEKIDPSQPFTFHSCNIRASTKKTIMEIKFNCSSTDESSMKLSFNFQVVGEKYDLVGIGTGATIR